MAGGHQEPGGGKLSDEICDESGVSSLLDGRYLLKIQGFNKQIKML